MASNHTPNYGLSQWEKTDKVIMEDFNADNAAIDAALGALAGAVEEQGEALAAHTSALSKIGNCAVLVTSYSGNNAASVTINCPYPPVYVFVRCQTNNKSLTLLRGVSRSYVNAGGSSVESVPSWGKDYVTWREASGATVNAEHILNKSGFQYTALVLMNTSL